MRYLFHNSQTNNSSIISKSSFSALTLQLKKATTISSILIFIPLELKYNTFNGLKLVCYHCVSTNLCLGVIVVYEQSCSLSAHNNFTCSRLIVSSFPVISFNLIGRYFSILVKINI